MLRRIDSGLPVLAPGERDELLQLWQERRAAHQHIRVRLDQLTVREAEVLGNLTLGRTVREIAARSFVSEATVRTQVKSILAKLGVSSQLAAVGLAHQVEWGPRSTEGSPVGPLDRVQHRDRRELRPHVQLAQDRLHLGPDGALRRAPVAW